MLHTFHANKSTTITAVLLLLYYYYYYYYYGIVVCNFSSPYIFRRVLLFAITATKQRNNVRRHSTSPFIDPDLFPVQSRDHRCPIPPCTRRINRLIGG